MKKSGDINISAPVSKKMSSDIKWVVNFHNTRDHSNTEHIFDTFIDAYRFYSDFKLGDKIEN